MSRKLKKPTKTELLHLWSIVDNEGFGYYMLYYGPDLNLLERMGFNKKKMEKAIELFYKIDKEITNIEELLEENE